VRSWHWPGPHRSPLSSPPVTIRGRITDNATQEGISGVTVSVGGRSTLTKADGRYSLSGIPAGSDLLRARIIGYAERRNP